MATHHVVVGLFIALVYISTSCGDTGTTPYIDEIFIGRCWAYQEITYRNILPTPRLVNCTDLWDEFLHAFQYKQPCNVTAESYTAFFELTKQALPSGKTMFWSGTYMAAHEFGWEGRRFITLEDTLMGYLVNGVSWCGQVLPPGVNYKLCPPCGEGADTAFWGQASSTLAAGTSGIATVMLNGSDPSKPAFRNTSFFALYELPNLNPTVVKQIDILVAHDVDKPIVETCNNGSVVDLEKRIRARGMEPVCYDNPSDVLHMLCIDDPSSEECAFANFATGT